MNNIDWKDEKQLKEHYNKHVLGNGLDYYNKDEPLIWKRNFNVVKDFHYQKISKDNTFGNHYLCKDKSSNTFSINYCNEINRNGDYLLTCTKINNRIPKIYSCYFTDNNHINPFMSIYYFINNLKKTDNTKYVSHDFTKYEINDTFNRYYSSVIKECNLDNPKYSNQEEITLLQMSLLKYFLIDNCEYKDRMIWINSILLKKINSILSHEKYELSDEEKHQLKNIYFDIKRMVEDTKTYIENKDALDLLIEINNLINQKYPLEIPKGKISRWTMFNNFKLWNK